MHRALDQFQPSFVVIDPVTNLITAGVQVDVQAMLTRLIDALKARTITAAFTSLTAAGADLQSTESQVSSLMDTWILTSTEEAGRRRSRWLYVLKSRGTAHSDEVREFRITDHGVDLQLANGSPRP
jgi:circadian clock protein KaiC